MDSKTLDSTRTRAFFQRMSLVKRVAAIFICLAAPIAAAQYQSPPVATTPSSTGNYTVSYTCDGIQCWLFEEGANVESGGAYGPNGSGGAYFTNKPPGTYTYQVLSQFTGYGVIDSATITVTVSPGSGNGACPTSAVPHVEVQESLPYLLRTGDANGDGSPDLFVGRSDGVVTCNGTLNSFILLRQPSGGFAPGQWSPSQAAALAVGWPTVSLRTGVIDVNFDHYADMVFGGLSAVFPGASDLIVYAPAASGNPAPYSTKVVDNELVKFLRDSERWITNPGFVEETAPITMVPIWGWVQYCYFDDYPVEYGGGYGCYYYWDIIGHQLTYDVSSFSSSAINIKLAFDAGGGTLTTANAAVVKQNLEARFGTSFGLGLPAPYPDTLPWPWPDSSPEYRTPWLMKILRRSVYIAIIMEVLERLPGTPLYHYTDGVGLPIILAERKINPPNNPLVYITTNEYRTSNNTRLCLSLDKMPIAAVLLPDLREVYPWMTVVVFNLAAAKTHSDGSETPGGGQEATLPKPVPITSPKTPYPRYFDLVQTPKIGGSCVLGG